MDTPTIQMTTSDVDKSPPNLSTASKAGLGVGVTFGALFIIGASYLAFSRWKKWREMPIETNYITRIKLFGQTDSSMSYFQDNQLKTPNFEANTSKPR